MEIKGVPLEEIVGLDRIDGVNEHYIESIVSQIYLIKTIFQNDILHKMMVGDDLYSKYNYDSRLAKKTKGIEFVEIDEMEMKRALAKMSDKEFDEAFEPIISSIKKSRPEIFYKGLKKAASNIISHIIDFEYILRVFEGDSFKKIMKKRKSISYSELKKKLPKKEAVQFAGYSSLIPEKITSSISEELRETYKEKLQILYNVFGELREFGRRKFKKDESSMILGTFAWCLDYGLSINLEAEQIILEVGTKKVDNFGFGEFYIPINETDKYKERILSATQHMRKLEGMGMMRYESEINKKSENPVNEDGRLMDKIGKQFRELIIFNGDRLYQSIHGKLCFSTEIRFDPRKIIKDDPIMDLMKFYMQIYEAAGLKDRHDKENMWVLG